MWSEILERLKFGAFFRLEKVSRNEATVPGPVARSLVRSKSAINVEIQHDKIIDHRSVAGDTHCSSTAICPTVRTAGIRLPDSNTGCRPVRSWTPLVGICTSTPDIRRASGRWSCRSTAGSGKTPSGRSETSCPSSSAWETAAPRPPGSANIRSCENAIGPLKLRPDETLYCFRRLYALRPGVVP